MTAEEFSGLLARASSGDDDALAALLAEFGPQTRARVAAQMPQRWQAALECDDIMQISYLEAFLRVGRVSDQGPAAFAGWLGRIAENNLRDALRELERQKRPQPERQVHAPQGGEFESLCALLDQLGCTTTTPSRHAVAGELKAAMETALDALPADYATVIREYDLAGRNSADVAAALGRSEGAVFMLRARAHDRLRELFAGLGE